MTRRRQALLALALLIGMLAGCGRNTPDPVAAGEGAFGVSAAEESAAEAGQDAAPSPERTAGSFSMPYNSSFGWNPYACVGMENRAVMQLIY